MPVERITCHISIFYVRCHLFLAFFLLSCLQVTQASPENSSDYVEIRGGLVELSDGSIVEGSASYGGEQPDFYIRFDTPLMKKLLHWADELGKNRNAHDFWRTIEKVVKKVSEVYEEESDEYEIAKEQALNHGGSVDFEHSIRSGSGVCREHSILVHLLLTRAGFKNKLVYVDIGGADHGFVIVTHKGRRYIVDAYFSDDYHKQNFDTLIREGKIKLNFYPRYWVPKAQYRSSLPQEIHSLSFDDYKALIMHTVKRIPELRSLWQFAQKKNLNIYLSGGLVRGVLGWINENLKTHSPDQIKKLPMPEDQEHLLLQDDSDIDLVGDQKAIDLIRDNLSEYDDYDITQLEQYNESVAAGGSKIDKILVSPKTILDLLGGLSEFFEGRLSFKKIPSEEMNKTYWFREMGNSETTMALRFLRHMANFPELTTDPLDHDHIRAISAREFKHLTHDHRRWIFKALKKLSRAYHGNVASVLIDLREFDLLRLLGTKNFYLEDDLDDTVVERALLTLKNHRFTKDEMAMAELLLHRVNSDNFTRALLLSKTSNDFVYLLKRMINSGEIERLDQNKIFEMTLDHFLEMNPSADDRAKWGELNTSSVAWLRLRKIALKQASTAAQILEALTLEGSLSLASEEEEHYDDLIELETNRFFAASPTPSEIHKWRALSEHKFLEYRLSEAKSAQAFLSAVKEAFQGQSLSIKSKLAEVVRAKWRTLEGLHPRPNELAEASIYKHSNFLMRSISRCLVNLRILRSKSKN